LQVIFIVDLAKPFRFSLAFQINDIVVFKLGSRKSKLETELKVTHVFRNEVSDSEDLINGGRDDGVGN